MNLANTIKAMNRHNPDILGEGSTLYESHFKVGETVSCKKSGKKGKIVKVDPSEEGKYYTVKQSDGSEMKYSPDELDSDKTVAMKEGLDYLGNPKSLLDSVRGVAEGFDKELKKDFGDRKDKDIDNDGDVDDSDEYLHKKRKTISKSKKEDKVEINPDLDEGVLDTIKKEVSPYLNNKNYELAAKTMNSVLKRKGEDVKKHSLEYYATQLAKSHAGVYVDKLLAVYKKMFPGQEPCLEEVDIDESAMTDIMLKAMNVTPEERARMEADDLKRMEDIVKSMKNKASEFKKKYGDRWKNVMYATAAKLAQKKK